MVTAYVPSCSWQICFLKKKKKYLKKKNSEKGRIWIDSDLVEVW